MKFFVNDDSHLVIEFKKYYVLTPSISFNILTNNYLKNKKKEKRKKVKKNFEYNSKYNEFLSINEIKKLLNYKKSKSLPYSRQFLDKSDFQAVNEVLKSDFLTQGKKLKYLKNY